MASETSSNREDGGKLSREAEEQKKELGKSRDAAESRAAMKETHPTRRMYGAEFTYI